MNNFSIVDYFINASLAVQLVMLILVSISILSWTFIMYQSKFLRRIKEAELSFQQEFWAANNLAELYRKKKLQENTIGTVDLFLAGFSEYANLSQNSSDKDIDYWNNTVQRAMYIAQSYNMNKLEKHLNFLATAGSISPYIGLLGTVWGIMTTLQALSGVEHATISMVAPGISEALVATALWLFAAIPAVIYYNRFSEAVNKIENQYHLFREEFTSLVMKQLRSK